MRRWVKNLFVISLVFSLSACQHSPVRQLEKVKNGMDKTEVLELMGTPWTTTRLHGKDRWIYVFYDNNVRVEREVHFSNGAVVYVGEAWQPEPEKQAEIRDKKNDDLNKQWVEEEKKNKEIRQNAYSEYEKEVKGEGKKVKYLPDYQEIK